MLQIDNIIFVLGMHRSGTSAVTRLLNILGADLGGNLLMGHTDINKKGFWENREFIDIHDNILKDFDSAWFDFRSLPKEWWLENEAQSYCSKIIEVIEKDYNDLDLIAVKDPRLCRLLPLWLECLKKIALNIMCVLALRNPREVVSSLIKRDGIDRGTAICLWLAYVLESEFYSRGLTRTVVNYDVILKDWRTEVIRMSDDLSMKWPIPLNQIESSIAEELDPKLRHHHTTDQNYENSDKLMLKALEVYNKINSNKLEDIREYLDKVRSEFYEWKLPPAFLADTLHRTNQLLVIKTKQHMRLGENHHRTLKIINERDRQHSEKDQQITELDRQLAEKDQHITKRDQQLAEKDQHITERDRQLDRIQSHWTWRIVWRLMNKGL
jgi:hypothetical protein